MNDHTDMSSLADYRQSLVMALRLKDVPGDRIGEIVAEVESHVADTGEDPTAAFGDPREYAASLTGEHRPDPWWITTITVATSAAAGWCVAQGTLALLLGDTYAGQSGWLWVVIGLVVGLPGAAIVRRRSTRIRDPRTGDDLVPSTPWGLATLVGLPIAVVLVAFGAIRLFG